MLQIQNCAQNERYSLSAPLKNKYFEFSAFIKQSLTTINNNNNNKSRISAAEDGGDKRERGGEAEDGGGGGDHGDDEGNQRSCVFVEDRVNKRIYQLEFRPTNVNVIPIFLKTREIRVHINEKCNQPKGRTIYENVYNNKARRFSQLAKSYKLNMSKAEEKPSVMSCKKPLLKKRPTYPSDPKLKPSISNSTSNLKRSIIYINYKNVLYKISPKSLILKSSVAIDFEAKQKREKLLRHLNMELPTDMKNKAQIIVDYKGDILKFTFTLSDINCNKLKVTSTIGIMATDDDVYIRDYSTISFRTIYIAVPRTNYEYIDPMIKRKHQNQTMKFNKMDPLWLVEQRRKRIKAYNKCRNKNPYEDIMELKMGSNMCYESFNCINKVKGGTWPCSVLDEDYEKWVRSVQKRESFSVNNQFYESMESTFDNEVPDWDLVLSSK